MHDGVSRRHRPATQPRLNGISNGARKRRAGQRPHGYVANGTDCECADLADAAETTSAAFGGNLERHTSVASVSSIAQLGEQHCGARLKPHRGSVGRRRTIDAQANMHPCGTQIDNGRNAGRKNHVAARTVGRAHASRTEAMNLVVIRHHAMRNPCARATPTGALEVLHRAAAKRGQRERVVLRVLGKVGVQPNIESLSEFGRSHHQLLGDAKR